MIAINKHGEDGYIFSGLDDSIQKRNEAIQLYQRHEKDIIKFISVNGKKTNDIEFYHGVGQLIQKFETKNFDELKFIKQRVRFIFDENKGGLKKDTSKINYCDYAYEISKYELKKIKKITHSCWVYLWQCSSLTEIMIPFFLEKTDDEKSIIKNEGFIRPFGKILTKLLKNVNTQFWDNERKKIPISISYNLTYTFWKTFEMKRGTHEHIGDIAQNIISLNFKEYLMCYSDPSSFENFEKKIVKEVKLQYNKSQNL